MFRLWLFLPLVLAGCVPEEDLAGASGGADPNWPIFAVAVGVAEAESGGVSPLPPDGPRPPGPSGVCPACEGTGKVGDGTVKNKCNRCGGDGKIDPADAQQILEELLETEKGLKQLEAELDAIPLNPIPVPLETPAPEPAEPEPVLWETDWDRANTAAKLGGLKVLVIFHNSRIGCKPCIELEKNTLTSPEFLAVADRFVGLKLDGAAGWRATDKTTAETFNVRQYPWAIVADPDAKKPLIVGAPPLDPADFVSFILGEKK